MVCPPTAAMGMVKNVFWHAEGPISSGSPSLTSKLEVDIAEIWTLSPWQTFSMRVNEMENLPSPTKPCIIEARQSSITLLKNPKYMIEFAYVSEDGHQLVHKAAEIFKRRLRRGQFFRSPCMGRRRYPANVRAANGDERPISLTLPLGRIPWGREFLGGDQEQLHTFDAELAEGRLLVPSFFQMLHDRGRQ